MKPSAKIGKRAPTVAERYRRQLIERIESAGLEAPGAEDDRLLKEVVYFADRSDISEELTRLQSHFQQFDDCRRSKEPVGRMLDFLAQEMNRPLGRLFQGTQNVQQGTLACPTLSHYGDGVSRGDIQVDVTQDLNWRRSRPDRR